MDGPHRITTKQTTDSTNKRSRSVYIHFHHNTLPITFASAFTRTANHCLNSFRSPTTLSQGPRSTASPGRLGGAWSAPPALTQPRGRLTALGASTALVAPFLATGRFSQGIMISCSRTEAPSFHLRFRQLLCMMGIGRSASNSART